MAVRNMKTCVYRSDDGKLYLKRLDARYQAQDDGGAPPVLLLGAVVASSDQLNTLPNIPRDLKPRHLILATADGLFKSKVEVFTPERYIEMTPPQTFTFYDGTGTSHTGVIRGHEGEHSMHKTDIT